MQATFMSNRRLKRRQAVVVDPSENKDIAKTLEDPESAYVLALELHLRKPVSLSQVAAETHFTRNEIKSIYRAFKESTPTAIIHRDLVRGLFTSFFKGDAEHYADLIFNAFDSDGSGIITFDKFIRALSVLCRGDLNERLEWLYHLYDPQQTGFISWHRLLLVITAMSDLTNIGSGSNDGGNANGAGSLKRMKSKTSSVRVPTPRRGVDPVEHANYIFNKFDPTHTGMISKQQFMEICMEDSAIRDSLMNFDQ